MFGGGVNFTNKTDQSMTIHSAFLRDRDGYSDPATVSAEVWEMLLPAEVPPGSKRAGNLYFSKSWFAMRKKYPELDLMLELFVDGSSLRLPVLKLVRGKYRKPNG